MAIESPIERQDNWFRGEDKIFEFTVKDAAGAVVNITGWTLTWTLYRNTLDPTELITKSTGGNGITITDGAGGVLQVSIARTDTEKLDGGEYFYVLRRTGSGTNAVLAYGKATLRNPYQ